MNEDRLRKSPNVGIIGSSSLLGKELMEMIEDGGFPLGKLIPLETEEYAGLLQEFAGDIKITQVISPEALEDVDIAFFACGPEMMAAYLASGVTLPELAIDLTQTGREGTLFLSGLSDTALLGPRGYFINPYPSTIVIARVLARLQRSFGVRSAAVTVLEPASERGTGGVDELQQQTVNLLNFQPIEYKVFGGQLAFNLLAAEDRVTDQLARLSGTAFPSPIVTVLQAPIFHSLGFSIFADLGKDAQPNEVRAALREDSGFVVHDDGVSPLTVVGTNGIQVGQIHCLAGKPSTIGLWVAADNLRLAAANAIRTAENIMLAAIGR